MRKIESFQVNHLKLKRGIYVSRKDKVGENIVTTFDIRMKEPNREPVINTAELHTIEHLVNILKIIRYTTPHLYLVLWDAGQFYVILRKFDIIGCI